MWNLLVFGGGFRDIHPWSFLQNHPFSLTEQNRLDSVTIYALHPVTQIFRLSFTIPNFSNAKGRKTVGFCRRFIGPLSLHPKKNMGWWFFTNPLKNMRTSKWVKIFPNFRGENQKIFETTHLACFHRLDWNPFFFTWIKASTPSPTLTCSPLKMGWIPKGNDCL